MKDFIVLGNKFNPCSKCKNNELYYQAIPLGYMQGRAVVLSIKCLKCSHFIKEQGRIFNTLIKRLVERWNDPLCN